LPIKNLVIDIEHFSIEEGLSQNTIICSIQDSRGFMWFGTEDGLNRFDGYTFKKFFHNPSDPYSLSHNRIKSIYEDREGSLWVGTMGGGLNKFIREKEHFIHFKANPQNPYSLSDNTILSIYEDRSGYLWLGTYAGLNRFDKKNKKFHPYYLKETSNVEPNSKFSTWVTMIIDDNNKGMWLGTSKGLMRFYPEKEKFIQYGIGLNGDPKYNKVTALCKEKSGLLWIGTNRGIRVFDPGTGKVKQWETEQLGLSLFHSRVETIFRDHKDIIWVGAIDGLYKYDPAANRFEFHCNYPDLNRSLSSNFVISFYEDISHVMWVGTYSGLCKFDNKKKKFSHFRAHGNSYEDNIIFAINQDSTGVLWIGTYGGGLHRYDRKTGNSINYIHNPKNPLSISDNKVMAIHEKQPGVLWIGTEKGLNKFDILKGIFYHFIHEPDKPDSISDNIVLTLFTDKKGELWIGTSNGLNRLEKKSNTFTSFTKKPGNPDSLSHNFINSIVEDSKGILWIGTYGGGLNRFDRNTGKFTHYLHDPHEPNSLSNNKIYPLLDDGSGNLWIGTNGGGLSKLNKKTGNFTNYTRADGLPNHVVLSIMEDHAGNLWISTNGGISKFDPGTGTFRNYVIEDGLQGYEFFQNSCFKSKQGEMFFGGSNGFNVFVPDNVRDNPFIPQVVFTSINKFNKNYKSDKSFSQIKELNLSHSNNLFSVKFAALDYTAPQRNQYAYMLEGFDDNWIQLNNKREITFTRLPPGKYVLRVKGSNSDGVWNEEGASLKIDISSPFWQSVWIEIAFVAILFGIVFMVQRIRTRNLSQRMEKDRLKRELRLKADFTAMLVHDLRSPLTAIIGYSELMSEKKKKIDARKAAKIIAASSQKMLRLINDMLDLSKFEAGKMTLNREPTIFSEIVNQIIELLTPLFERKKILVLWEQDTGTAEEEFLIDSERIGQVVNNLLSNAIKFTPVKGNIIIKLSRIEGSEHLREFSVTDDGPGIPFENRDYLFDKYAQLKTDCGLKGTGLGLAVSKMIIEAHGGIIGFRPGDRGKGSTFFFRIPI